MKRVALIGYGALGKIVVKEWAAHLGESYELVGVLEKFLETAAEEIGKMGYHAYGSAEELLEDKPDYVIELAGVGAVKEYGQAVLEYGCNLIVASVGALADDEFKNQLEETAKVHGCKIYVTSGAVGGFDVFQTIALMGGAKAKIDNFKAPASLNGAPYLEGRLLPEDEEELVFQGSARKAIAGFPKNVNVAISSGLASVGLDEMQVTIHSKPSLVDNIHQVVVENESVRATVEIASKPDKVNPKSSVVTAWSVIALLKSLESTIQMF